ncbi:sialoadhesin [Lampris incognitus]|uniref:sialoadhesin n=1 Tax=Lampris incognitus TaxID=2546036 RepID=UPI0024B4E697|nr:sialoadhesin [Lampris incognitus]
MVVSPNWHLAGLTISPCWMSRSKRIGGASDVCDRAGLNIITPQTMVGLEGSCLQIPCTFVVRKDEEQNFNVNKDIFAVWLKGKTTFGPNPEIVVFNSSGSNNLFPMELIGDLKRKNCSTNFSELIKAYADKYFFRCENSPFMAMAVCNPVDVKIIESPPSPTIDIPDERKEGRMVTINCSAIAPCPEQYPTLTWSPPWHAETQLEKNEDQTYTARSHLNVTLSHEYDGLNIGCSAIYNVKNVHKTANSSFTLNVSYTPKNTSAHISPVSGVVSVGSWVNMTCSSKANPPVTRFTWFKGRAPSSMTVHQGDFYSFNVTDERDAGVYFCMAENELGCANSSEIRLEIKGLGTSENIYMPVVIGVAAGVGFLVQVVEKLPDKPAQEIHYGEIDFKMRSQPSDLGKVNEAEQDTEYAEVNVPRQAKRPHLELFAGKFLTR